MNRRDFIKLSALTSAGIMYHPLDLFSSQNNSYQQQTLTLDEMTLRIAQDGSFSISSGDIAITNCYPVFDLSLKRALSAETNQAQKTITYRFEGRRKLHIRFSENRGQVLLNTALEGFDQLPRFVFPLGEGEIKGADRFLKQGMGSAGPSGIFAFPETSAEFEQAQLRERVWSYDSYLVAGLLAGRKTLTISVNDHSKFLFRSTCYNKHLRFGLTDRHLNSEKIFINSGFRTEAIKTTGAIIHLPEICIMAAQQPFALFNQVARNIAEFNKVSLPHTPRYYYCSWNYKEHEFTQDDLDKQILSLGQVRPTIPLQTLQIDNGYCHFGEWLEANHRFPLGMKHAFAEIKKAGYEAGIWIGPFMVSSNSFIFKNHKEWLLRDLQGNILTEWESHVSGGSVHVLDTSHPDAFQYLRRVFSTMKEWGATTFKTDFLDWGHRDSTQVKRFRPGKTSVEYFREVATMIRETIGPECYWVGCAAPFAPLIGLVDGMRVSNNVSQAWGQESTINMFESMVHCQYFNNVFWQNDPDGVYARQYNIELTENERIAIAYFNGIMGGVVNTSDMFAHLTDSQLDLIRFLNPGPVKGTAQLPFWTMPNRSGLIVALRPFPRRRIWGLLFVNTTDQEQQILSSIKDLIGFDEIYVYLWTHRNSFSLGLLSELKAPIPPRSARLLFLNQRRESPTRRLRISGLLEE